MSKDDRKILLRILDRVPIAALIASPVTGKILWVNERLVEMAGEDDAEKILGRSLADYIQPSQLAKALADLAKVAMGQSPPPVTYQLRKASGAFAAGQVSSVPMMMGGQPAMLSFVADVSEREQWIHKLEESEQRYRCLLESMPTGVIVVVRGTIMYANQAIASALGYESADAVVGRSIYKFVHEEHRDLVRAKRKSAVESRETTTVDLVRLLRKDGSVFEARTLTNIVGWGGETATQTLIFGADAGGIPAPV